MSEFSLIADIVNELGARAQGRWVEVGPGDDSAVVKPTPGCDWVSSIDSLVEGVHFPGGVSADLIGYRAMMVSLSDLAAMGARPRFVLIALNLPRADREWVTDLARGVSQAAADSDVYVCGGNLAQGQLAISVSVHGEVPTGGAVLRSTAQPGDRIWVSGELGGAAACVRAQHFTVEGTATPLQQKYYRPRARVDLIDTLRTYASACIDISDGLAQDAGHLAQASNLTLRLESNLIPVCPGANLEDALYGGDDYELLCTTSEECSLEQAGFIEIGGVARGAAGIVLDGQPLQGQGVGYDHFVESD
ncbi:MAG: thiamine-phosphate kinase [Pseudomonadota bacterium]